MNKLPKIIRSLSLPVTAIMVLVALLIFSQECRRDKICPPDGYILVQESFIDSLRAIADMPPDTIIEIVFTKGDIVYLPGKEVPVPVSISPQTNFYTDSIVNDSISVWVEITVQGVITDWDWQYQPIIHEIETIIKRPVPYPVPYEVPVSKNGLYAAIGIGGNQSAFMFAPEIDLLTKKDNIYGLQYLRFDQNNFYLFKIGTKIKLRR